MRTTFTLLAVLLLAPPAIGAELEIPQGGSVVSDDLSLLPEPVQKKREQLLAAAKSGDIAGLKAIMEAEPGPVVVSYGEPEDPIAYLKEASADKQGVEILARLAELLDAPYAAFRSPDGALNITWPYLANLESLSGLTPEQEVDAIRLIGYDEWTELKGLDAWNSWRVGIEGDGRWTYFVAGD